NAGSTQLDTLLDQSHPEPVGACRFQRSRTLYCAVTVGISLHHRHQSYLRIEVTAKKVKVTDESRERNLRPGWALMMRLVHRRKDRLSAVFILKAREFFQEDELYAPGRPITLFADNDLRNILLFGLRLIDIFPID